MNKLLIAAVIMCMINACSDQEAKHGDHAKMDSASDTNHAGTNENNEIKQLMDEMMTKMHRQKLTGNNDVDYAGMMLEHHRGAVNMAKLQLSKGSDTALKTFSGKLIADQQKEITLMDEFISRSSSTTTPGNDAFKKALDASMQTMMNADVKIYHDIDKDFVAQMIPHHQSAVDMAKAYLKFGNDPGLRKMSEDIMTSQTTEIGWLDKWNEEKLK
ncbi:MAG: DUF305 domain-containing protein [Rhizobacter sp.]|nr:DUF305 domain-containing protein [Ferruginibacter sp.]